MQLSQMQETFCWGVAIGLSAREAARQASYGLRYALAKAAALGRRPAIAKRIEGLRARCCPNASPRPRIALTAAASAKVVNESWELILASKAANDRRSALAGPSLISDVTGLKQASLRLENVRSPLDGMSAVALQKLLEVLDDADAEFVLAEAVKGEAIEVEQAVKERLLGWRPSGAAGRSPAQ